MNRTNTLTRPDDPRTRRRAVARAAGAVLVVLAALMTAGVSTAPPASAAGKPTMFVYGDSIAEEMRSQLTYVGSANFEIQVNTYGGTSLCDWVPQILRDAVPGTRMVGLAFTGNWFTPCMRPGGTAPDEATAAAIYRRTLDELIPVLNARGVAVMLIGAPPTLAIDGSTVWSYVNTVYPQAAIDWRARGADVVYTDAGRRSLATPEGLWTETMPCLSFETATMGCTGGRIIVRAPDHAHFCPTNEPVCPVWSSGAWRYATAVNDAAVFRVRPTMGSLDLAVGGVNKVDVAGWAIDPDNDTAPTIVHLYVGGVGHVLTADAPRSDLGALFPLAGPNHGYRASLPAAPGTHNVCAFAINVGAGANSLLGCRTVTVRDASPFGYVDGVSGVAGGVTVGGWAIDPDTTAPIAVHVYVDSAGVALMADGSRPDVGAAFPAYGSAHGFSSGLIPAAPGRHQVCAYGINVGAGGNSLLGCRTVTVPDTSPIGYLDAAIGVPGGVSVAGWAIDPDTTAPIAVHVYVDSAGVALTADGSRPDVGAVFPAYGSAHGYTAVVAASPGSHRVCAYGINVGPGANSLLGCRTTVVPS